MWPHNCNLGLPSSTGESHVTGHHSHPYLPTSHPPQVNSFKNKRGSRLQEARHKNRRNCLLQTKEYMETWPSEWPWQSWVAPRKGQQILSTGPPPQKASQSVHAAIAPSRWQCALMRSKRFFGISCLNVARQLRITRHVMKSLQHKRQTPEHTDELTRWLSCMRPRERQDWSRRIKGQGRAGSSGKKQY